MFLFFLIFDLKMYNQGKMYLSFLRFLVFYKNSKCNSGEDQILHTGNLKKYAKFKILFSVFLNYFKHCELILIPEFLY